MMLLKTLYHVMNEIIIAVKDMRKNGFNEQTLDKLAWLTDQLLPMVKGTKPLNLRIENGEWTWDEHEDFYEKINKKENKNHD